MNYIPDDLRQQVIERAGSRCEYCTLSQSGQEATFHIDHVAPQIAGGSTNLENLALACVSCSLRKHARQTAIDPDSGNVEAVFNPRQDNWATHFYFNGNYVVGITPTGGATVSALQLNRPLIVAIRGEEALRGRHPPK